MPLYMDFHDGMDGITIEEVRTAHTADLAVQAKYGVTFKQFWVNSDAGTVFCLVDGPDKQSCEAVHKEAHGNLPCNLSEVESGFYDLMMATGSQHGLVLDKSGEPDTGTRTTVVVKIKDGNRNNGSISFDGDAAYQNISKFVLREISKYNGRELGHASDEFIGIFNQADEAINCALSIQSNIAEMQNGEQRLKISVTTSQPLTSETDDFFEKGLKLAKRLCEISKPDTINVSSLTAKFFKRFSGSTEDAFSIISVGEEEFATQLFDIFDVDLYNSVFNVEALSRSIGISRPQLYRKITSLTGKSPNNLIRELRLEKAKEKLKNGGVNIAEVSMSMGFSNPSYFTKCFQEAYGYSPSLLLK